MKKQFIYIVLVILAFILMSWGYQGHRIISGNAGLSFNEEMEDFNTWLDYLVEHASDADIRKQWDPEEGPRHYIDIDLYDEFQLFGNIPQDLDEAIAIHGYSFVYDAGVLPWATIKTYDSLVECMRRLDWDRALFFAADLGHYVADGHMPLHITANYDGQYTGNQGIHSRYESSMINAYYGQILYEGHDISAITDISQYVFDYLYDNYTYVDSVLAADDYAKTINPITSSYEYREALWERTRDFTIKLFEESSHALAELIYAAWAEAGKPDLLTGPFIFTHHLNIPGCLRQNTPNPFSGATTIRFSLPESSHITLEVRDMNGNIVDILLEDTITSGDHTVYWSPLAESAGVYYLLLRTKDNTEIRKMMLMR